jgi:hypothetical protein
MWAGVSTAVGGTASAAATSAAAATGASGSSGGAAGTGGALAGGGMGALKMLTLGTLLGGTLTVGTAAVLLHVGPTHRGPMSSAFAKARSVGATPAPLAIDEARRAPGNNGRGSGAEGTLSGTEASPLVQAGLSSSVAGGGLETVAASAPGPAASSSLAIHPHGRPIRRIEDSSSLSIEASLITEARSALAEGDALGALRKARTARTLPVRQLVPEELAVEAQALRALGRDAEANSVDQALRAQYPESALGR